MTADSAFGEASLVRGLPVRLSLSMLRAIAPKHPASVAITLLVCGTVLFLFVYALISQQSPYYDPTVHFLDSVRFLRDPANGPLLEPNHFYPWFPSVIAAPFNLLSNYDPRLVSAGVNSAFLVAALVSIYQLVRSLFGQWTALLAAALFTIYPIIYGQATIFMLDLPATSMTVLAVLLLVKSEGFRIQRWTLLLALVLVAGCYTRYTYLEGIAGPLLFVVLPLIFRVALALPGLARDENKRWLGRTQPAANLPATVKRDLAALRNGFDAAIVAALLLIPWFLPRLSFILGPYQRINAQASIIEGTPQGYSFDALLYFARGLWQMTGLLPESLAIGAGLVYFVRGRRGRGLLVTWIVASYLAATFSPNKEPRYWMAALPAIGLVTAAGMQALADAGRQWRQLSIATSVAVLAVGFSMGAATLFDIGWLPQGPEVGEKVRTTQALAIWSRRQDYASPQVGPHTFNVDGVENWLRKDLAGAAPGSIHTVRVFAAGPVASAIGQPLLRDTILEEKPHLQIIDALDLAAYPSDFVIQQEPISRHFDPDSRYERIVDQEGDQMRYVPVHIVPLGYPFSGDQIVIYRLGR